MRQELKMMSSKCDCTSETIKARSDQPVDLRVNSAIERSNIENFKSQPRVKPEKSLILATLLTMSSPSTSYRGRVLYGAQSPTSSKENVYQREESIRSHYYNEAPQPYCRDAKRSIIDKLQIKRSFFEKYSRYKTWDSRDQLVRTRPPFGGTPDVKIEQDKEFLPNYRKFYSRCSNQSPSTGVESTTNPLDCTIIRERLSNCQSSPSTWNHGHLYRLLQRDQPSESQCHKRKLLTDTNKDKTLRCLLSSSVDDKIRHLSNHEKQGSYESIKKYIKIEPCSKSEGYGDWKQDATHVYCPQAVRAIPNNTVLRGLLVSNCKIPAPILPPSGPPSSGSPGSESTSSGSTDSGVFSSDNIPDERRRASRVLSGRHVKSGTGASLTTLRLLRQMIMDRKSKNDRKL